MNLLTQNSKIKKTSKYFGVNVFNWTLPAYKTKAGKLICPMASSCIKFCYARKGFYTFPKTRQAHEDRYEFSKTNEFVPAMINEIKNKKAEYIRVHDAGDYYSKEYLNKWIEIMLALPDVKFYSYTNMVALMQQTTLPENFDVIFSNSGKQTNLINKRIHRHTEIFNTSTALKSASYVNASEYDLYATKWFSPNNNKIGLIYH